MRSERSDGGSGVGRRGLVVNQVLVANPEVTVLDYARRYTKAGRLLQFLRDEPEGLGIVFSVPPAPAARRVFSGMAYLRRLATYRRRVRLGLPLFPETERPVAASAAAPPGAMVEPQSWLEGNIALADGTLAEQVRTCRCARCGIELLGPSSEPLREALTRAMHKYNLTTFVPRPVAATALGRPYCAACVDLPVVPVPEAE